MKSTVFTISFFVFLLNVSFLKAQKIKIPDENFKKRLILLGIDENGNNEIEKSEAAKITKLYVDKADIFSLEGIKHFVNLEEFGFYYNKIRTVDLSGMKKLKRVYGFRNEITEVNISNAEALETLNFDDNLMLSINITGCKNLTKIEASRNKLRSLDITNLSKLKYLDADNNQISNLKMGNNHSLIDFYVEQNAINHPLDFTQSIDIENITIYNNPIPSIKIMGLQKLKRLSANNCKINSINFAGTKSLQDIRW